MADSANIFVLSGSPRKNGATAALLDVFFESVKEIKNCRITTSVLDSYQLNVKPCIHCGACKKKFACIHDDFSLIDNAVNTADLLVVSSPVYCLSFPAPLKAIFDRCQKYFEAKFSLKIDPVKKHKNVLLLSAYGSNDPRGVSIMEEQLMLVCKALNASFVKTITAGNTDLYAPDLKAAKFEIAAFLREQAFLPAKDTSAKAP
ncbi:MAG: flavodoxin family protein [Spirochaetaceae bacterium]|jgi:multimeric flavodoxin WrbA|nr:flavodoxin family protein [Spirochaetaceae bacterium]